MAYRVTIELAKELDLRDASNVYNLIMEIAAKKIGLMSIDSIELADGSTYDILLNYRQGYHIQKAIDKYHEEQEERRNLAFQKAAKKIIDALPDNKEQEEEVEDAKH